MSVNLDELNKEQLPAVLTTEGAVLVTAGAGSGKTRLLTHRIAYLIEEKRVKPYNILAITFTNKAANEMKERLENMIPEANGLWVSTFHAMCVRILRRYIDCLGYTSSFSIYAEQEKDNVLKKLVRECLQGDKKEVKESDAKENDRIKKRASFIISDAKNNAMSPEQYRLSHDFDDDIKLLCDIYARYELELKRNNALDFDDLLVKTYALLTQNEEAREYYQNKFHYIHVDEFQDTNVIQYKLVKILSQLHQNVFVVGDEDQCIYGWRGANIGNIIDFTKDFKCTVFKLEQNYRSTKRIISLANSIIGNNVQRLNKTLWTQNDDGDDVTLFCARNETNEAEYVVNVIKNLVEDGEYRYSDIAVIMRLNALSRTFEERFLAYNVPHRMFGGFKFFERKEIKDLLAYLRILVNGNDNEAILRVINFPKRGIGAGALQQLLNYSQVMGQPLFKTVMEIESNPDLPAALIKKTATFQTVIQCLLNQKDNLEIHELVRYLVKLLNLKELYSENNEENENRIMNVTSFIDSVRQFEQTNVGATLEDYLQMITLYTDLDEMNGSDDCVSLATIHSVKGLEFKVVFVIGAEDGVLPLSRSLDSLNELEEERRLMYVAVTRAMQKLYITWAATRFMYNERKYSMVSRFLKEAGLEVKSAQPSAQEARQRLSGYSRDSEYEYGSYDSYSAYTKSDYSADYNHDRTKIDYSVYRAAEKPKIQSKNLSAFTVGKTVEHKKFGKGEILTVNNEAGGIYAEINFEKFGKMTLSLQYAPLEITED